MISFASSFLTLLAAARLAVAQSVIAHYMAQELHDYAEADITKDIQDAMAIGIDAFVFNIASPDYEVDKINMAYPIAEQLGFQFLYSIDTAFGYNWQPSEIVSLVTTHANSSATYKWKGKPLLSSFQGADETRGDDFWAAVKSGLKDQGIDVALAPGLTKYRDPTLAQELVSSFPSIDGFLNWWSWPDGSDGIPSNLTTATDLAYKQAISSRNGPYIMAVSPWQFKNIQGDAWVEDSDYLWKYRWEQAINDVKPDIVEIVTWNDYGESHYIVNPNPVVNLGDDAPHYVVGVDHSAWQIPAMYYIKWFKSCGTATDVPATRKRGNGKKRCVGDEPSSTSVEPVPTTAPTDPAPQSCGAPALEDDELVYWFRKYPKDIECSGGAEVRNKDVVADEIFAYAMLKEAGSVRIDAGASSGEFALPAGISMVSIPFPDTDETPFFQILRGDDKTVVKSGHANGSIQHSNCTWYDFNPYVGSV